MTRQGEFDALLGEEIPHLRRYALALTGSAHRADDLVQDCLERALRKWRLWNPASRLRSWLFRMLYRQYLNSLRGQKRRPELTLADEQLPEVAVPARHGAQRECEELLSDMAKLPEAQRNALWLVALEDMSYAEAAWVLNIPIGTLRSRLARGRDSLRARHQPDETVQPAVTTHLRSVR